MAATVWKGYMSFGLVSFAVRLTSAARAETVHYHMLHKKDLSRVKEVWFCAEEDKQIERSDIVKGYETSKGAYVVVEDEELRKIAPATATTMDILQFVDNDEVDPIFFESSYYVAPEDKTAKPYTLFMAALEGTKQDAIAEIAMHNREHIVLIRPAEGGLILHTLYQTNSANSGGKVHSRYVFDTHYHSDHTFGNSLFVDAGATIICSEACEGELRTKGQKGWDNWKDAADELHKSNKSEAPKSKYTAKELELAKSLVNHLKAPFKPQEFADEYRANVERLIKEKQKGKKITIVDQPRKAPVIDLMEALKRSIEAGSGKPAAKGKARKTGGRRKAA